MPTIHESTCRFPCEIVATIVVCLTSDLDALKACSLTCRSWYIVTVPHLQHTLTLRGDAPTFTHGELNPPSTRDKLGPLSKLHELCLMPLVKEIRVEQWGGAGSWFVPQTFSRRDLGYFSTFTNVHTLKGDLPLYTRDRTLFRTLLTNTTVHHVVQPILYSSTAIIFPLYFFKLGRRRDLAWSWMPLKHNHPRYRARSVLHTETTRSVGAS